MKPKIQTINLIVTFGLAMIYFSTFIFIFVQIHTFTSQFPSLNCNFQQLQNLCNRINTIYEYIIFAECHPPLHGVCIRISKNSAVKRTLFKVENCEFFVST